MKVYLLVMIFLLFCCKTIGQEQNIKTMSDNVIMLFNDLIVELNDTSAITYPFVEDIIDPSSLEIPGLSKQYGFSVKQFSIRSKETFSLKANKYFRVIDSDSVLGFHNMGSFEIEKGKIVLEPFYYFLNKFYHKTYVRYLHMPIVSKNGKFAIVEYEDVCGGLCGSGAILVMQKVRNKWRIIKTLVEIVS